MKTKKNTHTQNQTKGNLGKTSENLTKPSKEKQIYCKLFMWCGVLKIQQLC